MKQLITDPVWVGMDVHQDSITAAILFGNNGEPRVERLPGDLNAVRRMFRRLSKQGTPRSCYEASGAGFVLQRCLEHDGFHCEVIAPSLVPKKPGDRRKTDRLDAIHLAHHYRAGNLVPVTVPSREQEEIRQLVRSRLAVQSHVVRLKHRIVRVLATHGHRFTEGKSNWTRKHRIWLRKRAEADLIMKRRRMGQNPQVVAISIKAQHRLQKTYWKIATRKHPCTAVTAVARELCGFIWSALWAIESQED